MGTCSVLREEFRLAKFGFSHNNPHAFVNSQWQWPCGVFLVYRVFTALWCSSCFLYYIMIDHNGGNHIMTYLTTWTYLMLTLYLVTTALVVVFFNTRRYCSDTRYIRLSDNIEFNYRAFTDSVLTAGTAPRYHTTTSDVDTVPASPGAQDSSMIGIPWYMKMIWLMGNIVYPSAIIVTSVFFGYIYQYIGKTNFIDVNVHGINTFFVFVDACLVARPVRLLHVIYPMMYGVIYIGFTVIYWNADKVKHVIYPVIVDWNFPALSAMVTCLLNFVAVPLLHLLHYAIFRLRVFLYKLIYV